MLGAQVRMAICEDIHKPCTQQRGKGWTRQDAAGLRVWLWNKNTSSSTWCNVSRPSHGVVRFVLIICTHAVLLLQFWDDPYIILLISDADDDGAWSKGPVHKGES